MISIKQAAKRHLEEPLLLPDLFKTLKREGIRFRRGQVTMIAGQPNSGKSLLALFYGVQAKVPTLYISADTDAYTTAIRTASIITGTQINSIEESFKNDGAKVYTDALSSLRHIEFSFDPSPTLDDETESAIFVLHHTSEAEGDPDRPPARRAIQGKISQLPEMILTVAMETEQSELRVACVKNRFAKHSARGDQWVSLRVDASRMTLKEEDVLERQLQLMGVMKNVSQE